MAAKVNATYNPDRTVKGDLQKIRVDVALIRGRVFSTRWGLREIKREVNRIECAVFNHRYGLEEIKEEVSAIAAEVSPLAAAATATLLTTGPFFTTPSETLLFLKARNYTTTTQTVTFAVNTLSTTAPCVTSVFTTTMTVAPCCVAETPAPFIAIPPTSNLEIVAQVSSRTGVNLYANTGPTNIERFYSSMWLPLGTICP